MIGLINAGTLSKGKNVPLKNAIGMMKKFEYIDVSSGDFARIPVTTPRFAKRKQLRSRVITKRGVTENPEGVKKPTMIINNDAKMPFTMPASTSPTMMADGLIGACTNT